MQSRQRWRLRNAKLKPALGGCRIDLSQAVDESYEQADASPSTSAGDSSPGGFSLSPSSGCATPVAWTSAAPSFFLCSAYSASGTTSTGLACLVVRFLPAAALIACWRISTQWKRHLREVYTHLRISLVNEVWQVRCDDKDCRCKRCAAHKRSLGRGWPLRYVDKRSPQTKMRLDRCAVCAVMLFEYEGGRCVMCGNIRICRDCAQACDEQSLQAVTPRPNRFSWDLRSQSFDESPVRPGDLVCLECGVYSAVDMEHARWMAEADIAGEAVDRLVVLPGRRMGQSFRIWKAFCRGRQ